MLLFLILISIPNKIKAMPTEYETVKTIRRDLDYLYKTSKEYNSDIECFYKIAKKEFLTNTNLDNYNWEEKYKNAEFKIEFNDDIITNLLIE